MNWYKYTIKTAFVLISALLIASCNEKIETNIPETPDTPVTPEEIITGERINVLSEVLQTKAGYEGTTSLPDEFVIDINQKAESIYNYYLVTMSKETPEGNSYREQEDIVLCWAGDDHSNVEIKALTYPNGLGKDKFNSTMTVNVATDQTNEENIKKSDLLGAKTGDGIIIDGNDIKITFNHLMSKLYVTYSFKDDAAYNNSKVNSITLQNTCITGGYSYVNMDYDSNVTKGFGDIKLYHNTGDHTAEALFFPHVQTTSATLVINTTINGVTKDFKCPVSLKSTDGFLGGKRYKMNIKISATAIESSSVEVQDWVEKSLTKKKILWLGTSIPAGNGENNYPRMVGEALGYTVTNQAMGGSRVTLTKEPTWETKEDLTDRSRYKFTQGYSLSATRTEIEEEYRKHLVQLGFNDTEITNWINEFKNQSYETILLPYVASHDVIIFDHGFNDALNIVTECEAHPNNDGSLPKGLDWLEYCTADNFKYDTTLGKYSYFNGMQVLIEKCLEINPNIQIIIGNYFASRSLTIFWDYWNKGGAKCTELILAANEAIARMWNFDIVNVYKYTGLDNDMDPDYTHFCAFCPDGVHPHSGTNSNQIITDIYVKELKRIFAGN